MDLLFESSLNKLCPSHIAVPTMVLLRMAYGLTGDGAVQTLPFVGT